MIMFWAMSKPEIGLELAVRDVIARRVSCRAYRTSVVLAAGRLSMPNQAGDVFVLKASPTFELLATNSVKERTNASLGVSDGHLFLLTEKSLWCSAEPK